jgi:hypothetical protein
MRRSIGSVVYPILINTVVVLLLMVCTHIMIGVRFAGTQLSGDLTVENNYRYVRAADGRSWWIVFQYPWDSSFSGLVRDVAPWEDAWVPFMTHDILITSGEFTDPEHVVTLVKDHIFFFMYWGQRPDGDAYPLHVYPATREILDALQQIKSGDVVRVTGREIWVIRFYNAEGDPIGQMTDNGCNTILVTKVEILPKEQAMP